MAGHRLRMAFAPFGVACAPPTDDLRPRAESPKPLIFRPKNAVQSLTRGADGSGDANRSPGAGRLVGRLNQGEGAHIVLRRGIGRAAGTQRLQDVVAGGEDTFLDD